MKVASKLPPQHILPTLGNIKAIILYKTCKWLPIFNRIPSFIVHFFLWVQIFLLYTARFPFSRLNNGSNMSFLTFLANYIADDLIGQFFNLHDSLLYIVPYLFFVANSYTIFAIFKPKDMFNHFFVKHTPEAAIYIYFFNIILFPIQTRVFYIQIFYFTYPGVLIGACLMIISSIPIVIIRAKLIYNFLPFTKDVLSRLSTNFDIIYLFYFHLVIIVDYFFTSDSSSFLMKIFGLVIQLGLNGGIIMVLNYNKAFWDFDFQSIYTTLLGFLFVSQVIEMIFLIIKFSDESKFSIYLLLQFLAIPLTIKLVKNYFIWNTAKIFCQENFKEMSETDIIYRFMITLKELPQSKNAYSALNKSKASINYTLLINGFFKKHLKNCVNVDCICKHRNNLYFIYDNAFSSEKITLVDDMILKIHLTLYLMTCAGEAHPKSCNIVLFRAFIMCAFLGFIHQAYNIVQQMLKTFSKKNDFLTLMILLEIKKFLKLKYQNKLSNFYWNMEFTQQMNEDLDLAQIIEFKKVQHHLYEYIIKTINVSINFFNLIENSTFSVKKMQECNLNLINYESWIDKIMVRLEYCPHSLVGHLILYAIYLKYTRNRFHSFQRIMHIIESRLKIKAAQNQKNSLSNNFFYFDENAVAVVISGQREDLAIIKTITSSVKNVFQYTEAEMVGASINDLMSEIFRQNHDLYMTDYLDTGKEVVLNKKRQVFGMNKSKFIFPLSIYVKIFPNIKHGVQYVSYLRGVKDNNQYIMTYQNGIIDSVSEGAATILKVAREELIDKSVFEFFPKLEKVYPSFDYKLYQHYGKLDNAIYFEDNIPFPKMRSEIFLYKKFKNYQLTTIESTQALQKKFNLLENGSQELTVTVSYKYLKFKNFFKMPNNDSSFNSNEDNVYDYFENHMSTTIKTSVLDLVFKNHYVLRVVVLHPHENNIIVEDKVIGDSDEDEDKKKLTVDFGSMIDHDLSNQTNNFNKRDKRKKKYSTNLLSFQKKKSSQSIKSSHKGSNRDIFNLSPKIAPPNSIYDSLINKLNNIFRKRESQHDSKKENEPSEKYETSLHQEFEKLSQKKKEDSQTGHNKNSMELPNRKTIHFMSLFDLTKKNSNRIKIVQEEEEEASHFVDAMKSNSSLGSLKGTFKLRNYEIALNEKPPLKLVKTLTVILGSFCIIVFGLQLIFLNLALFNVRMYFLRYDLLDMIHFRSALLNDIVRSEMLLYSEKLGYVPDVFSSGDLSWSNEEYNKNLLKIFSAQLFQSNNNFTEKLNIADPGKIKQILTNDICTTILDPATFQPKNKTFHLLECGELIALSANALSEAELFEQDPYKNEFSYFIIFNTLNNFIIGFESRYANYITEINGIIARMKLSSLVDILIMILIILLFLSSLLFIFWEINRYLKPFYHVFCNLTKEEIKESLENLTKLKKFVEKYGKDDLMLASQLGKVLEKDYHRSNQIDSINRSTHLKKHRNQGVKSLKLGINDFKIKNCILWFFIICLLIMTDVSLFEIIHGVFRNKASDTKTLFVLIGSVNIFTRMSVNWISLFILMGPNYQFRGQDIIDYQPTFYSKINNLTDLSYLVNNNTDTVNTLLWKNACEYSTNQSTCELLLSKDSDRGLIFIFNEIISFVKTSYENYNQSASTTGWFEQTETNQLLEISYTFEYMIKPTVELILTSLFESYWAMYSIFQRLLILNFTIFFVLFLIIWAYILKKIVSEFESNFINAKMILKIIPFHISTTNLYVKKQLIAANPEILSSINNLN